jgi:aryl-alcohol dehydrogenase-like predicted oxidoreductase
MRSDKTDSSRRHFLKQTGLAAGWGLTGWPYQIPGLAGASLPARPLGQSGLYVGIIGLGTSRLHCSPRSETLQLIHYLLAHGVNFIDTAYRYGFGETEERLGEALHGKRDRAIVATKTANRDKRGALAELETSLQRLRSDHVDLWQIQNVSFWDFERGTSLEGILDAMETAKRQGKCRFVGVTGHAEPSVIRKCLNLCAFDTVMAPLNCVDAHYSSFENELVDWISHRRIGVIGMKALMGGQMQTIDVNCVDALRYAFSLPVSTTLVGCTTMEQARMNLDVARTGFPMNAAERMRLTQRTGKGSGKPLEWYKRMV